MPARVDRTLILLGLLALIAALLMAIFVTERLPHLEDEITYLFQARTYARGALWAPPAPPPVGDQAFFTPFVVNFEGRRIGKYPIGWPLMLAVGEAIGAGWLINPLFGAGTVMLTYAIARDLADRRVALIAALLALTSPFFLIQSSTYMGHAAAAFWTSLLLYAFYRAETAREQHEEVRGWSTVMGLAAGMLALTRPLTTLAVALPFVCLFLYRLRLIPTPISDIVRDYWPLLGIGGVIALLQPFYLYTVTGSPFTNLYTLIWPYDRLGFGPGIGPNEGHSLRQALATARIDLIQWTGELFGWPGFSQVPIILGLVFAFINKRRRRWLWLLLMFSLFLSLILVHLPYWVGASIYGPRYYYEAHAGLAILAALGICQTLRLLLPAIRAVRYEAVITYGLVLALITLNLTTYLPERIAEWHGLYTISREPLDQLARRASQEKVLVLVRGGLWMEYGTFFALNSPWYDDPVVAAHDLNLTLSYAVMALYPDREVWFYRDGEFSREPSPYDN